MVEHEIVHVAIAPPTAPDAGLVEKVAAIINREKYDTRLLMAGQLPKMVAHCQDMQAAESMARELRELGLAAVACRDSELHKPSQTFSVHTMEFGEGRVVFRDEGGQERAMESGDVFLILKGKKHTFVEEDTTDTKMKLNLPATMLTGGIPVWRKVREETRDTSVRSQFFLRLYDRDSPETSIEVLQDHMHYSFLGPEMSPSSLTNFNTVAAKMQEAFPRAIFDDRLTKSPEVNAPSATGQDDPEARLRLIYLLHLEQSNPGHQSA